MNKRARMRLIGVTAIIVLAVGAIGWSVATQDGAMERTVGDVLGNPEFIGERVKVSGQVVPGSWDGNSAPMRFDIRDREITDGPVLQVVYNGGAPGTFGDDVIAILTGSINADGVLESENMMTECPSKYESADGALTVYDLESRADEIAGSPLNLTGFVVADSIVPMGTDVRFSISDRTGEPVIGIHWDGALPDGMTDGSAVVIGGSLGGSGIFDATDVALSESER